MKQQKTFLRRLRREREISIDFLALKTGINNSTLSRFERGLIDTTPENKRRIARFFDVSPDELQKSA